MCPAVSHYIAMSAVAFPTKEVAKRVILSHFIVTDPCVLFIETVSMAVTVTERESC